MIRRSLFSNSVRLTIAGVLAIALWIFVSFTENPQQTLPLTNVPIAAEGLEPGLTLVDPATGEAISSPDAVLNMDVVGPRDLLTSFNKQNVQAYIRLNGVGPGIHQVPTLVRVVPPRSEIRFNDLSPEIITVEIEEVITTTVPLSVTTIGQPPTSYEASVPLVSMNGEPVETVRISGPSNLVNQVVAASIEIDLSSQTSNLRTQRDIVPINAEDRPVEGVQVLPEEVLVAVNILSSSGIKRVPIIYVIEGQPPTGLRPEITLNPAFVSIVGSSRALANVDFIETEPLVLDGRGREFTETLRLRFPSGVTARDARAAETTVAEVQLVPIETPFVIKLPVLDVNRPNNVDVELSPRVMDVRLRGSLGVLQADDELVLNVDLNGLAPGIHVLTPTIELPTGLTLVEPLPAVTVTLTRQPTPTPVPSPTSTPTESATDSPAPTVEVTPEDETPTPSVETGTPEPSPTAQPSPTP